jgi:hypothetical protein
MTNIFVISRPVVLQHLVSSVIFLCLQICAQYVNAVLLKLFTSKPRQMNLKENQNYKFNNYRYLRKYPIKILVRIEHCKKRTLEVWN